MRYYLYRKGDVTLKNEWIFKLDDDDISFIKTLILSSGSLKSVATHYDTSYHIVRNRLNALIQKIQLTEAEEDWYVKFIKSLALDDAYDYETAKQLIEKYTERTKHKE